MFFSLRIKSIISTVVFSQVLLMNISDIYSLGIVKLMSVVYSNSPISDCDSLFIFILLSGSKIFKII